MATIRHGPPTWAPTLSTAGNAVTSTVAALPAAARQEALRRFGLLKPHLFDGVPLTVTARENGVPERTARRWLAAYRADGLRGLARPRRRVRDNP